MPYVRSGRICEDRFTRVADDGPLPDGAILVSAARFVAQSGPLLMRPAALGVLWPNNRPVNELGPHLDRLALVALVFPSFRDGRAYTQARLLRERYGFRGEVRATGQVLRDQFLFLVRAGFDAFEVAKDADAAAFVESLRRFDVFYQPTGDGRITAAERRRRRIVQVTAVLTRDDTGVRTGWSAPGRSAPAASS